MWYVFSHITFSLVTSHVICFIWYNIKPCYVESNEWAICFDKNVLKVKQSSQKRAYTMPERCKCDTCMHLNRSGICWWFNSKYYFNKLWRRERGNHLSNARTVTRHILVYILLSTHIKFFYVSIQDAPCWIMLALINS